MEKSKKMSKLKKSSFSSMYKQPEITLDFSQSIRRGQSPIMRKVTRSKNGKINVKIIPKSIAKSNQKT